MVIRKLIPEEVMRVKIRSDVKKTCITPSTYKSFNNYFLFMEFVKGLNKCDGLTMEDIQTELL